MIVLSIVLVLLSRCTKVTVLQNVFMFGTIRLLMWWTRLGLLDA